MFSTENALLCWSLLPDSDLVAASARSSLALAL